jgi:hypothetical protein
MCPRGAGSHLPSDVGNRGGRPCTRGEPSETAGDTAVVATRGKNPGGTVGTGREATKSSKPGGISSADRQGVKVEVLAVVRWVPMEETVGSDS